MKNKKPLILVVNDDGIRSLGIKVLISIMSEVGEVFVVAPDRNRSGVSHAITLHEDIYIEKLNKNNEFVCSGTPVDCVKIAVDKILPRLPDLCVSGINHGSNHSINSLYSGTLHGAMEGTVKGIPSISFSHLSYSDSVDLSVFKPFIHKISLDVLNVGIPNGITLNINIPSIDYQKIKGLKICKSSNGLWSEDFKPSKKINKKQYYTVTGTFQHNAFETDTDAWALENNFISLVPISIDNSYNIDFNILRYLEYDF